MRDTQEIFGRYLLVEQLDAGGIESWLGMALEGRDTDTLLVLRRVPLWVPGRASMVAALRVESERLALGAHQSLPRLVDAGSVGDVPYLAYAYVPGVTVQEALDGMTHGVPPPPVAGVMALTICMCNAMHALGGLASDVMEEAHFHPARVVMGWEELPVLLGAGRDGSPSRQGLYGLANLVCRLLTGRPALSAGEPVPDIPSINPDVPRAYAEVLSACLDGRFTESALARVANGVEALMNAERGDAVAALHGWLAQHFPRQQQAYEARRMVLGRMRRRVRRESNLSSVPGGMAKVVEVQFRRKPAAEVPAQRLSFEELFQDVREDPTAFLRESTSDSEVELLQNVPVTEPGLVSADRVLRGHLVRTRDGREMVRIPAGLFQCGPERRLEDVEEFFMDRFPVTHGDYQRFIDDTGHPPPHHWPRGRHPERLTNHPVTLVSHADACAYARWAGKELPDEVQWEKAARGTLGWLWPFGSAFNPDLTGSQWRKRAGERQTEPVGSLSPRGDSPFGVSDVGAVWEWTRTPLLERGLYVVRGGVWRNRQEPPQVINRSYEDRPSRDVGFRCMATPAAIRVIFDG